MKKQDEIKITTLLGKGCAVEGDFKATGSCRVDGQILGNVSVEETLILGAAGKIEGDVTAKKVLLAGEVIGNIDAPLRAELICGAKVLGDIHTAIIVIDEKAIFQGKLDMEQAVPDKRVRAKVAKLDSKSAAEALNVALNDLEDIQESSDNPQE